MGNESARLIGAVLAGERGNVRRCVDSLRREGLPVEVFDTTSDRRYQRLARAGVTVTPITWADSFAGARNEGIDSMRSRDVGDAVLWVDTDEVVEPGGVSELRESIAAAVRATAEYALCPEIVDERYQTNGVARVHSLDGGTRFRGRVHEYVVRVDGGPLPYQSCNLRIHHDGYSEWDRTPRNRELLAREIEGDGVNPRWRPFWIRDAGSGSDAGVIARLIREQARLDVTEQSIGGLSSDEYTRMIAWHATWNVANRAPSPLLQPALSRLRAIGVEVESELLYLRIVADAMLGSVDSNVLDAAFEFRRRTISTSEEFPWLDAGISIALDANGREIEARAYRAESTLFSDPFTEDSTLRPRFRQFSSRKSRQGQ